MLLKEALPIIEKFRGPDSLVVANTLTHMAMLLIKTRRNEDTGILQARSESIQARRASLSDALEFLHSLAPHRNNGRKFLPALTGCAGLGADFQETKTGKF